MNRPEWIDKLFNYITDIFFRHTPQPQPDKEKIKSCKIISHRGEHDNITVFENTVEAFETVKINSIYGIELDIRWTKDLHPVVFHDRCLKRLFNNEKKINQLTLAEINQSFPIIPTLETIIKLFGKQLHLMVEIKEEIYPEPEYQNKILEDIFSSLEPVKDFHLITLNPKMFQIITFPQSCFLPVAETKIFKYSSLSIKNELGGITGHYLFLNNHIINKHHEAGQKIGTGFISSKNCLFREINRNVDWIFSNHALKLQKICKKLTTGD
jgi:glycerophosphoryl diester phosphodiesterase